LTNTSPAQTQGNQALHQDSRSQNERTRTSKSDSTIDQDNSRQADQLLNRKSVGLGQQVSPMKEVNRPTQNQDHLQKSAQPQSDGQGGTRRSPNPHQPQRSPNERPAINQGNRRSPGAQSNQQQGDRRSPNEHMITQQLSRRSPNQHPPSEGKKQVTRISPNIGQLPVRQPVPPSRQRIQGQQPGHSQGREQYQGHNSEDDQYHDRSNQSRGPGSSPTPHHQRTIPEYMGQRRSGPSQDPVQRESYDSEDVRAHDYASQDTGTPESQEHTPLYTRGQGHGQARHSGSKRSRQDQDKEQGDVFSAQGPKRRKNERPATSEAEIEPEQEEGEDVPQFDAFSEVPPASHALNALMIDREIRLCQRSPGTMERNDG